MQCEGGSTDPLDALEGLLVGLRDEVDGQPEVPEAPRAPDAVEVRLRGLASVTK